MGNRRHEPILHLASGIFLVHRNRYNVYSLLATSKFNEITRALPKIRDHFPPSRPLDYPICSSATSFVSLLSRRLPRRLGT